MRRWVLALLLGAPTPAVAQTETTIGASFGSVRYADGFSSQALALTPTVRRTTTRTSVGMSAAFLMLADNQWSFQGSTDLRLVAGPRRQRWRVALESWASFTTRSYVGSTAAGSLLGEFTVRGARVGAGLGGGGAVGWLSGGPAIGDLRLRGRAWATAGRAVTVFTAEPTRHLGEWYTDVTGAAALLGGATELVVSAGARLSDAYGTLGAGSAALRWYFAPGLGLELTGGSYLPDLIQGLPRASFVSLGLRVRRPALGGRPEAALEPRPLVATRRDGRWSARFRLPSARRVEIAGEWTDWQPVPLAQVEPGIWLAAFDLAPGVYEFNLIVDGNWSVPDGVATAPDRYGGRVAVLIVR